MVNENYFKVKKLLLYGMIGAVLTMIGDFLLLGVDSNGAIGALGQYILAAEKISYTASAWPAPLVLQAFR